MADFTVDLQNFRPQFPFSELDPNMAHINHVILHNSTSSLHQSNIISISSNDNLFNHQAPEFPMSLAESTLPGEFQQNSQSVMAICQPMVHTSEFFESNKRKAMDMEESSSMNSSTRVSAMQINRRNSSRRVKRVKSNEKEEQPKEVVHVRARRGQATDSHSLAERVRRGKINDRLRCLQDIVPGCYKSMGMAVMLDEIINYVQSLQNQVEFLSMKLTEASTFYNFNSETDAIDEMQREKAKESERKRGGGLPCFHSPSTWTL